LKLAALLVWMGLATIGLWVYLPGPLAELIPMQASGTLLLGLGLIRFALAQPRPGRTIRQRED
jgi:hypothetical protein